MTVQDALDILEIQSLIARYPVAVDSRDFDALDALFTPDAVVDYSAFGGPCGSLAQAKRFLAEALAGFVRTQHMVGLPAVTLQGDRAQARTCCHNPMVIANADGTLSDWLFGLWYVDELARTADGWRFTARREERCYSVLSLSDSEPASS